jgi:hypothetical protein
MISLLKSMSYEDFYAWFSSHKTGRNVQEAVALMLVTNDTYIRDCCAIALSDLKIANAMPKIEALLFSPRTKGCRAKLAYALANYGWILISSENEIKRLVEDFRYSESDTDLNLLIKAKYELSY